MGIVTPAKTTSATTPMVIGSMGTVPETAESGDSEGWWNETWPDGWASGFNEVGGEEGAGPVGHVEGLWVLKGGRGGTSKGKGGKGGCHGRGSPAHVLANCPYKGRGKGKGGSKGSRRQKPRAILGR